MVFPKVEKATLSNGMKVLLAERHAIPVVDFNLMLDAGYAADQGGIPGTASLAMAMLDEGTKTRTSLQISDESQRLGANIGSGSELDTSYVTLSALKPNLDASLALYADIVLNPSFPEADFKRLQKQQIAGIQREKAQPVGMALRVFPKLLYGSGHPYGLPFSGSGYEDGVAKITRDDLVKFHEAWFKPDNATMVIVGDTTMAEIKPKLEALFKDWKKGTAPSKKLSTVAGKDRHHDLHPRQARRGAVGDPRRPARRADRQSRRDRVQDDDPGARRLVRRAAQHEPARGQALVVRLVHVRSRRARPAPLHRLRAGADRQDEGSRWSRS